MSGNGTSVMASLRTRSAIQRSLWHHVEMRASV
jgi:hypothetical protein